MEITPTELDGVLLISPAVHEDARGVFAVTFHDASFVKAGLPDRFVQSNFSRSVSGVLRGLHYQIQDPQGKLIQVVHGRIFDVVVDIRRSSASFGKWLATELSSEVPQLLWVPPGFAHGFYVTGNRADVIYHVTDRYAPEHERTILWNDPDLAIPWPASRGSQPILSDKDARGRRFREADVYE